VKAALDSYVAYYKNGANDEIPAGQSRRDESRNERILR
jgi:hypothetical protein